MLRAAALGTLLLAFASSLLSQGRADPMFRRYPFDSWKSEPPATEIAWKFQTPRAVLSPHQRLVQRIHALVESAEVQKRRSHGEIIFLFELQDATGRQWRTRQVVDFSRIPPDAKALEVTWSQDMYVLPGIYKLSFAVVDAKTKEHSFATRELKVQARRSDPLPGLWKDLPSVEFVRLYEQTDAWFQPNMRGRLHLPVASRRPVQIEVIMNMTLSERSQGSLRAFRRNMSILIPALRVLSGMSLEKGSLNVTVLDLALRKKWEQKDVHGLDWRSMREPFAAKNPGVIDVQSLAGKAQMQQFFWDSVLDTLRAPDPETNEKTARVVIVLSSPVFLERQYKVEPPNFPKDPDRRVYYLQYRPISPRPMMMLGGGMESPPPPAMALPSDDLEHTLKLLDTKVFSLISPEQFRKALASILADIARM